MAVQMRTQEIFSVALLLMHLRAEATMAGRSCVHRRALAAEVRGVLFGLALPMRSVTSVLIMRRTVSWITRRSAMSGMGLAHPFNVPRQQRHLFELFQRDQPGTQAVIDIMVVVGDLVGEVGDLRLQRGTAIVQEALADVAQLRCVVCEQCLRMPSRVSKHRFSPSNAA